ncbi:MAG: hypothetical protein NTZ43_10275 [Gemmatimonadetes bacterium]|nr:hypothetical protein [Gemmatimonadota bacterium]
MRISRRLALFVIVAVVASAPLGAQKYRGPQGDTVPTTPSARRANATRTTTSSAAVTASPSAARAASMTVDPTLSVAPARNPRDTPVPKASGGGSWGAISVSSWGGSPGTNNATAAPSAAKSAEVRPASAPAVNTKPAPAKP